jgi:hypothetical protein
MGVPVRSAGRGNRFPTATGHRVARPDSAARSPRRGRMSATTAGRGVAPPAGTLAEAARAADLGDHLVSAPATRYPAVLAAVLQTAGFPVCWIVIYVAHDVPGLLATLGASVSLQVGVALLPVVPFVIIGAATWQGFRDRPGPALHLFRNGALLTRAERRVPQVLRRSALEMCEWGLAGGVLESPVPVGSRGMAVRDGRGRRQFGIVAREIEELAATAAEVELPRARAQLATGRPVRYGPVVLAGAGLRVGERDLGWAVVGGLVLTGRHLLVCGTGPGTPVLARVPRRRVPHQRVLLVLAGERVVAARQSG